MAALFEARGNQNAEVNFTAAELWLRDSNPSLPSPALCIPTLSGLVLSDHQPRKLSNVFSMSQYVEHGLPACLEIYLVSRRRPGISMLATVPRDYILTFSFDIE